MTPTGRVQCRPCVRNILTLILLDYEVAGHVEHALEAGLGAETPFGETVLADMRTEGVSERAVFGEEIDPCIGGGVVDHAGVEDVGVGVEEVGDLEVVEKVVGFVLGGVGSMEGGGRGAVIEGTVDGKESGAGL